MLGCIQSDAQGRRRLNVRDYLMAFDEEDSRVIYHKNCFLGKAKTVKSRKIEESNPELDFWWKEVLLDDLEEWEVP